MALPTPLLMLMAARTLVPMKDRVSMHLLLTVSEGQRTRGGIDAAKNESNPKTQLN